MSQMVINNTLIKDLTPSEKAYEIRDSKVTGFILRVQPSGRMTYICQYGRGKRETIGSADILTPTQARERVKQILADVLKGRDPQAEKKAKKTHTLESFITHEYAPWVEANHRREDAISIIKSNFFPDFSKSKLDEITARDIEKWRSKKLRAGLKPATTNRQLNPLKAALQKAVIWEFIKENPLSSVKPLKVDSAPKERYLTEDEEVHLMVALDDREKSLRQGRESGNQWRTERGYALLPSVDGFADHLKPMVILSMHTGVRRGELFNLKWTDIDFGQRTTLTVRGEGSKSGQTRHIPLNQAAVDTLLQWQRQNDNGQLVFHNNGKKFTNVNSAWRNVLQDAGISNLRWHDLRHTFASNLVMAGVDLNTVRELLGHKDIKTTLRYAHLAPKEKAAAVEKLVR